MERTLLGKKNDGYELVRIEELTLEIEELFERFQEEANLSEEEVTAIQLGFLEAYNDPRVRTMIRSIDNAGNGIIFLNTLIEEISSEETQAILSEQRKSDNSEEWFKEQVTEWLTSAYMILATIGHYRN